MRHIEITKNDKILGAVDIIAVTAVLYYRHDSLVFFDCVYDGKFYYFWYIDCYIF